MAKILFIRGGALGDFILTLPAIQLARNQFPECKIEILGYPEIARLAVSTGLADSVRSIEHAALAPFFAPKSELDQEMCRYLSEFDVVFSYLYDPDRIFQDNLVRAGVETLFRGPYRMDESAPYRSAAVQLAKPLESLGLYLEQPWVELSYENPSGIENEGEKPRRIALHPGSGSPAKNWSFESWVQVITSLHRWAPGSEFLIVSGEAEHGIIGDLLDLLKPTELPCRHLEQLPLSELGSELQQCDYFLGHDSGISHLAASTGVRGLVLFGPTNPKVWAPPHPNMEFLVSPTSDLSRISVASVLAKVAKSGFSTPS